MAELAIRQIPVLRDNYVYLIRDPDTAATAAIDPAVAGPVLDVLKETGWRLTHILNTHHHGDHTGATSSLKPRPVAPSSGRGPTATEFPASMSRLARATLMS